MGLVAACALVPLLSLTAGADAAPPNDDFVNAADLTGSPPQATGSNVDATTERDEPAVGDHSIWFKWTAPVSGGFDIRLDGCAPPFRDSQQGSLSVAVYRQSAVFGLAALPQFFHAEAGHVYFIAVASAQGTPGDPDICVRLVFAPANDDFAGAQPLTGFPLSVSRTPRTDQAGASLEPGEPAQPGQPGGSLWYSWRAPASGPVMLRVCEGALAVYTGDRLDALTRVATSATRKNGCGEAPGARATVSAMEGEVYRIAVIPAGMFQLLVGTQAAVLNRAGELPTFLYSSLPGQADDLALRLAGSGRARALVLEARGVTAANGCAPDTVSGRLRCPIPGRAIVALDVGLGDGNDKADIRLLGRFRTPSGHEEFEIPRRLQGGDGNDTLRGSAGARSVAGGWFGGLALLGGSGADRISGGRGDDLIFGGAGPDQLAAGGGTDRVYGGPGDDRVQTHGDSTDNVFCAAGRDQARLDGIDLAPTTCERRRLHSSPRAIASWVSLSNGDGEDADHLEILVACPVDVKPACRTRVTAVGTRGRAVTRRFRLAAGRFQVVRVYRIGLFGQLFRRGVRVAVSTQRRGRAALESTRRLPVSDDRYTGE